jgi:hypothetical protein
MLGERCHAMKMKARFKIEYEAEDGFQSPRHMLKLALSRAERGLKDSIEEGKVSTRPPA